MWNMLTQLGLAIILSNIGVFTLYKSIGCKYEIYLTAKSLIKIKW